MVLTVSFVLSPVTGLVCHRHQRSCPRQLDASVGASGPHDFAVRLKRRSSFSAIRVHRIPPYVRDDRETPLLLRRDGKDLDLIWVGGEAENFCKWDWTGGIGLNRLNKFGFTRNRHGPANRPTSQRATLPAIIAALLMLRLN
jgi:hypothetical protein